MSVSVVIPAAGCGERMEISTPKQFCKVLGKPLLIYTLEAFDRIPMIADIIVTVSPDFMPFLEQLMQQYHIQKVEIIPGGTTRHRSIKEGILSFQQLEDPPEIVVIHDGVRPIVPTLILEEVVEAARLYGAAGVVCPLVSTVVQPDEAGFLQTSLDRSKLRASEMPQAFQFQTICRAYQTCTEWDLDYGTECLHLVQKYAATRVKLITGNSDVLWKVTYQKDLTVAENRLRSHLWSIIIQSDKQTDFVEEVYSTLSKTFNVTTKITKKETPCDGDCKILVYHDASVSCSVESLMILSSKRWNIHVCLNPGAFKDLELRKKCLAAAKELEKEDKYLFVICRINENSTETSQKTIDIINSLVQHWQTALSGQIFYA